MSWSSRVESGRIGSSRVRSVRVGSSRVGPVRKGSGGAGPGLIQVNFEANELLLPHSPHDPIDLHVHYGVIC